MSSWPPSNMAEVKHDVMIHGEGSRRETPAEKTRDAHPQRKHCSKILKSPIPLIFDRCSVTTFSITVSLGGTTRYISMEITLVANRGIQWEMRIWAMWGTRESFAKTLAVSCRADTGSDGQGSPQTRGRVASGEGFGVFGKNFCCWSPRSDCLLVRAGARTRAENRSQESDARSQLEWRLR